MTDSTDYKARCEAARRILAGELPPGWHSEWNQAISLFEIVGPRGYWSKVALAQAILDGSTPDPFEGEEGESVGVRTGGRIMTPTTEESRRNFAAMLGVHDLCPPCPMTGGEEAAAVYLWPLLSYMSRSGVSFRIASDKYQTRVHVGLGLGCWTEEDEPDAVGRLDEVVRLISDALVPMF